MSIQSREDVIVAIQQFTDKYSRAEFSPGYSFGHIVLSDFNLADAHIQYCLKQSEIDRWEQEITKSVTSRNRDNEYSLRYELELIEQCKVETIRFLNWLLTIPESIREGG